MTTVEENILLTQTGKGTPMGELLRRYWHAIAAEADLDEDPVRPVRLLGEDLVLFRSERGELGLIGDRCAHRGISMAYGIPQVNGLRCAYHGWTYDVNGRTVDTPFEPTCLHMKIPAYPVQALGGLIFAYLGPDPVPLLPRFDTYVRADLDRRVIVTELPCNWLQCMDNSLDPVHFEHLHGVFGNYVNKKLGKPPAMNPARHLKIDFDVFEYGIYKRRLVEGDPEDCDDWTTGHPVLFPTILSVGEAAHPSFQIRTPVDDTHTLHILYRTEVREPGKAPRKEVPVTHDRLFDEKGNILRPPDQVPPQDMLAWVAQSPITDRSTEHLASSDKGILLFRKMLRENIERVQRGEDPIGVVRDPAVNEPMIELKRERVGYQQFRGAEVMQRLATAR